MRGSVLGSAWEAAARHFQAPRPLECRCGVKCSPHSPGFKSTDRSRAAEEQTRGLDAVYPLRRCVTMKASGGKSARTPPDEETGAAPSVAKLSIDANGGRGELRALGGGKHDEWNQRLTAQLAGSLPEARGSMTAATVEGSLGALTGQIGIDPQDPVEGMLSAQMIAANAAALDLYRRAWIPG